MTKKLENNSEAKAWVTRNERLSKLVSFNSTDDAKVNLIGAQNVKPQVPTQMTIVKNSVGEVSYLLDAEQEKKSVSSCLERRPSYAPLIVLDNPFFLSMLKA